MHVGSVYIIDSVLSIFEMVPSSSSDSSSSPKTAVPTGAGASLTCGAVDDAGLGSRFQSF